MANYEIYSECELWKRQFSDATHAIIKKDASR